MNSELINYLRRWRQALLLFSGGLDSSLLLAVAAPLLGPGLTALTFTGPHVPAGELAAAWRLAHGLQVNLLVREMDPFQLPDFRANTPHRCYACKKALLAAAREVAAAKGAEVIWDGTNLDDLHDFRPGLAALRESQVKSPLAELGWDKAAIRLTSRRLGLIWDKPPQSCLATRFPYHTHLTLDHLVRVGQAEAWLKARGFSQVRLRVQNQQARLELSPPDWALFLKARLRRPFLNLLHRLGWHCFQLSDGIDYRP